MNSKGFAVTGIIYSLMILFIILVIALMSMFSDRKTTLDKFKSDIMEEINGNLDVKSNIFTPTTTQNEFYHKIPLDGYYEINMMSSNGISLTSEFYFYKNNNLKITFNVNDGGVNLYVDDNIIASINNNSTSDNYYLIEQYHDRVFMNTKFDNSNQGSMTNGSFIINFKKRTRKNEAFDDVKYVKDCIYSDNSSSTNYGWSEFMVIHNGENIIKNARLDETKSNINSSTVSALYNYNYTDVVLSTKPKEEESCVVFKLSDTSAINLDYINVWHYPDNRIYFGRKLSVSKDGTNYVDIDVIEKNETISGNLVSAFNQKKVISINNKYFPIKKFDGANWIRIFHHNSKNGTINWSSRSQVLDDIYDTAYKKSLLNQINLFKTNNKYEFLLEYPDIDSKKYNRWVQSNDITKSSELDVKDYSKIHVDFTSDDHPFNGLKYSNGNYTVINGDDDNYYAIGYLKNNPIPGYGNDITGRIDLWIRIDEYLKIS